MRKINPAVKFVTLLAVTFVLAFKFDPILNFAVFAVCMVGILSSGVKAKTISLWMIPILIAAVGMFFTGYRFAASGSMPVSASDFLIYNSNVWNGLAQASRVLGYAGIGFLFTLTTDKVFLIRSFQAQFHVPVVFAYGLLAAWGIVPNMLLEYKRTRAAFRARGLVTAPFSPSILKPLLVKSIRWSEELSIAMESKGFTKNGKRTVKDPVRIQTKDWLFAIAVLVPVTTVSCLL